MLLLAFNSYSQSVYCPPNIDFEQGNFNNWYLYTGNCCPINTGVLSGAVATRHTITSGAALDAFGNFPIADPSVGLYSLKLGNSKVGAQAERARYYINVPAGLNDYSLLLKYAVVLENPSHLPKEQPRFEVKAYDSITNAPITCAQFTFVASSALPGFTLSAVKTNVYYKPWSIASLNLSGYAGRTIAVDFASGDCSLGQHFGYGYVDINCVLFAISSTVCKGTTMSTFTAPAGFQRYKWYDSTFTTILDTNQIAHIPTPISYNKYHVILTAYPGFGCDDTLSTTIYVSDLKLGINKDTFICKNSSLQLTDTATAGNRFQPLKFSWNPTSGLNCSTCLSPILTPTVSTRYVLSVTDVNGCVLKDSLTVNIRRDSIISQPLSLLKCRKTSAVFKVKVGGRGNYTYQWRKNGTAISGANLDSFTINNIAYTDTGDYSVLIKWGCDSLLSANAKLSVYAAPVIIQQPQPKSACLGNSIVIKVIAGGVLPLSYQWKKNGITINGATVDSLNFASFTAADTGYYQVSVKSQCDTTFSDSVFLGLTRPLGIAIQPLSNLVCLNSSLVLSVGAIGSGLLSYQWKKNGVDILGAKSDSFIVAAISPSDTGMYTVLVNGLCGSVLSQNANIGLMPLAVISEQPLAVKVCKGNNALFRVVASGIQSYQWFKNNVKLNGAIADSLKLYATSNADTGTYFVRLKGVCDSIQSVSVQLSFFEAPHILVQPQTTSVCNGSNSKLKVVAVSSDSLHYQWRKNGLNLNVFADSLFIASTQITDTGYYSVMIKTNCDSVLSDSVQIKRIPPAQILVQPAPSIKCLGDTFSLHINYTGAVSALQWQKNGSIIIGAHADSLLFSQLVYNDSGLYMVSLQSTCGILNSDTVSLKLNTPPQILIQPVSVTQCKGKEVVFKASVIGGNSYQWFKNGNLLSAANLDSLRLFNISEADTGLYFLRIKGSCDSINTLSARLSLYQKPLISQQPLAKAVCLGDSMVLKVLASSSSTLHYQWRKNGINIGNALNDSLQILGISFVDTGYYYALISNNCDSIISDSVLISIKPATQIISQPQAAFLCSGISQTFTVNAVGAGTLSYQWQKNGTAIVGANLDSLFLASVNYSDTGTYQVSVSGQCGIAVSTEASLQLNVPLTILKQPLSILQCKGSEGLLCVKGSGINHYQWYKNNQKVSSIDNDTLLIASLLEADTGLYFVNAKGACDSLFSDTVKIQLMATAQVILQPQTVNTCIGSNVIFRAKANVNSTQFQWKKNSMNIAGATSDSLVISAITAADTGWYYLVVKSTCDSIQSDSAKLSIGAAPLVSANGGLVQKCIGDSFAITVNAQNSLPLSYQWYKNGNILIGESGQLFYVDSVSYTDTGTYFVELNSVCGNTQSGSTQLKIITPTQITLQPTNAAKCEGDAVVFVTQGIAINTYQWFKNNIALPGANKDTLTIKNTMLNDTGNYYTYVSGNCNNAESNVAQLHVFTLPQGALPDTSFLCATNNQLSLNGFVKYLWSTGSQNSSIVITQNGKYKVLFTDLNQCSNVDSTNVIMIPQVTVNAGNDTVLCNESVLQLNAFATNFDSVRWDLSGMGIFNNPLSLSTQFIPLTGISGIATLKIYAFSQCNTANDELILTLKNKTSARFEPTDTLVCVGTPLIALNAKNLGGVFNGTHIKGTFFDPIEAGKFNINYTISEFGCTDSSKRQIEVLTMPLASFTYLPALPTIDNAVQFHSTSKNANSFTWDFGDGNIGTLADAQNHYLLEGHYQVLLTAYHSFCIDTVSQELNIAGSDYIWAPNAFTPNGDGINDRFKIIYNNKKGGILSIYNRWGELLYKSNDLSEGWDGTFKGKACAQDVYFYIVEYNNNSNKTNSFKGNFSLLD